MSDPRSLPISARIGAEFLGTLLLVAAVVGSGIMAERLTKDIAVALLANTFATAAILVVLITILAPVSGAHFNPAVSLVFALRRELPPRELALYIPAQVIGGIAGTALAHLMFDLAPLLPGLQPRNGATQWLSEIVATFALVLAILGGMRFRPDAVPWLVGLVIASAYWFTASTSFANPAVTLARGFTTTFSGIALGDVPGFVIAEFAGAFVAAAAALLLFARAKP
ncbi:MAG: aquaporin family protein [Bradyrhizobiaceae bacterium]|nr:aquaporin family protein [Bradyrhizobiaceae bacterium]